MRHSLTKAELAVMNLLWESDDRLTAKQIREALYRDAKRPQHGTVQRLLQSLEEKGAVNRDKSISTHFFDPAVSRQRYAGEQLESLVEGLTSGSFAPLITHLIESNKITVEEIDEIIQSVSDQE